ncbi:MAG: hypothetical protein ACRDX8_12880, partial [Acidimicrobiales bacterium]
MPVSAGVVGTAGASKSPAGAFLWTRDGGVSWSQASVSSPGAVAGVSALTCSPDGSCLALASLGAVPNFTLVGLRSADGGKTWTAGPPTTYRSGGGSMFSACGDASHCMAAFSSDSRAGGIVIATTANQGATWSVSPAPPTWDNLATALSCATGLDCSV